MQNYSILSALNTLSNIIEFVIKSIVFVYVCGMMCGEYYYKYMHPHVEYVITHRQHIITKLSYQYDDMLYTLNHYRNRLGNAFVLVPVE